MRLLHITPVYIPAYRYGGPIYSVHALCRSLAAAGHDVHVITTSVDGPGDSDVPFDRAVEIDGVQVHYCRSRRLRRLYWSLGLLRRCRAMTRDFDAVHLHSVFLFPTWAGARLAARAGVPYVLSPRGMLDRALIERRNGAVKRAWIRLIESHNLAGAAGIHLTSEEERRALADLDLALAPVVVIPNGVDAPGEFSRGAVSPDVRKIVVGGFDILSFGRISWKKRLDWVVRALAGLPKARLVIAGYDEEGDAPKLRALAEGCGVGSRVQFIPRYIDGADKEALFGAAIVFALPSISENFGNVVAEAMVRGLPVIVTERVGAAEMVQKSGAGVVAQDHEQGFAASLAGVLQSKDRLAAVGAAGASYAREHLSWHGVAREFTDFYRTIAGRNGNALQ
jgi:glycosyltransferase involved in cell wall biosynthesis